jgi:predicted TIM-barrel fold metal-dependent hydrolase
MIHAIDVHGHFGHYDRGGLSLRDRFFTGGIDTVISRARAAGVTLTLVSAIRALIPYRGDVLRGNEDARRAAEDHDEVRFWVVIDPRVPASFGQADAMLAHPRCVGIKIHPHAHEYEISQHGTAIFAFAAERRALVLTHSGDPGSYPEDFVAFADRYPAMSLILAHLGNSADGNPTRQVYAIQRAGAGNLYVDTSSASSMYSGLIEWAVGQIGAARMLFGTDTPLYATSAQRSRIDGAEVDDAARRQILHGTAEALLRQHARIDDGGSS